MDLDADGRTDVTFWSRFCSWVDEAGMPQQSFTNGLTSAGVLRPVDPARIPLGARLDSTNPPGFVPLSGSPNEFWGEFLALTLKQGNGSVRYGWRRDIRGSRGSSQFEQELAVETNQPIELGLPAEPRWLPKLANGFIPLPATTAVDRQAGILRRFGDGERDFNSGVASIAVAPDGRIWGVAVAGPLYSDAGKYTNVLFSVRADGGDWQNHRDLVAGTERVPSSVSITRAGLVFVHVATTQTMLFRYHPESGELTNVRSLGGMPKPLLSEVVQLEDDTLCATTADGFYRLQPDGTAPVFHSLLATGLKDFNRGVTPGNAGWLHVLGQTGGEGNRGGIVRCRPDGSEASLWCRFPYELSGGDPNQDRSALALASDGQIYGTTGSHLPLSSVSLYRVNAAGQASSVAVPPHHRSCWSPWPRDCGLSGHLHALRGRPIEHEGYLYGTVAGGWYGESGLAGVYRTPLPADPGNPVTVEVLTQNSEIPWWGSTYRWIKTAEGTLLSPSYSGIISFRPGQNGLRPLRSLGATGSDGNMPNGPLVRDGEGRLFGVSQYGGVLDAGTIFLASEDGSTNAILHSFTGSAGDVLSPSGSLVRGADGWLYGTSRQGDRHDFSPKLYRFRPADGTFEVVATLPGGHDSNLSGCSGLMAARNGLLYGTTTRGGGADLGTLFQFDPASRTLRVVHEISGAPGHRWQLRPELLTAEDGFIYGMVEGVGPDQEDADGVFRLAPDGSGFQVIARINRTRPDLRVAGGLVKAADGNLYVARGLQSSNPTTNEVGGEILRIVRGQQPEDPARMEVALASRGGEEPDIVPLGGLTATAGGWLVGLSRFTSTAVYRWHCVTGELQRQGRPGYGLMSGVTMPWSKNAFLAPLLLADGSLVFPAISFPPSPSQTVLFRLPATNPVVPQALAEATVQTGYGQTFSRRFSPLFTNACSVARIIGAELCLQPGSYGIAPTSISGTASAAGNHRLGVVADDCLFPAQSVTNWINLSVAPANLALTGEHSVKAVGSTDLRPTGSTFGLRNNDPITVQWTTSATADSPAGIYPIEPVIQDPEHRLANYQVTTNAGILKLVERKVRPTADSSGLVLNFPGIPGTKITVEQTDRLDPPVWTKTHAFTVFTETPPTVTIPPDGAHTAQFVRVTME